MNQITHNAIMMVLNVFVWAVSFGGGAYVVFWMHRSPWWFALAFAASFIGTHSIPEKKG